MEIADRENAATGRNSILIGGKRHIEVGRGSAEMSPTILHALFIGRA
jgi:hypothetical protein